MASDDLKHHRTVVAALGGMHTAPTLVNKLAKVASETDDARLRAAIEELNLRLKNGGHSLRSNEMGAKILEYAKKFIAQKKPAWQVIALREGWRPPERK